MATKRIKLNVINVLFKHTTYDDYTGCSSYVMSEGDTFDEYVKEDIEEFLESNCNEQFDEENMEIIDAECVHYHTEEFDLEYTLTTQYVTINID